MKLRCLIVDDSPTVLRAAGDLLERQGIAVVAVAGTGEAAMRLAEELKPDVVLVDIDLGSESGFDLARRLADTVDTAGTRSILMSTHDEADLADLIAASPAIGFVDKSALSAEAIHRLLERDRDERRY